MASGERSVLHVLEILRRHDGAILRRHDGIETVKEVLQDVWSVWSEKEAAHAGTGHARVRLPRAAWQRPKLPVRGRLGHMYLHGCATLSAEAPPMRGTLRGTSASTRARARAAVAGAGNAGAHLCRCSQNFSVAGQQAGVSLPSTTLTSDCR